MITWEGFAELGFEHSAHLALAHAIEETASSYEPWPDAWIVDERRIEFYVRAETTLAVLEATRCLLESLAEQATTGEVSIRLAEPVEGIPERWTRRAMPRTLEAPPISAVTDSEPLSSGVLSLEGTYIDTRRETIPAEPMAPSDPYLHVTRVSEKYAS